MSDNELFDVHANTFFGWLVFTVKQIGIYILK